MDRIERAARALCSFHKLPENTTFEGRPMWESYVDEAIAVISAIEDGPASRKTVENKRGTI